MKKKWIIILISAVTVVLLIGLLIFLYHRGVFDGKDLTEISFKKEQVIEVYSDAYISDFIEITDGTLIDDIKIDTSDIRTVKTRYTYLNSNQRKKEASLTVQVVDTTAPLVWLGKNYTVFQGSKHDFSKEILCADNYDSTPSCTVEGEYDLDQVGSFPLVYQAIDQAGNKTSIDFTLKVIEKSPNSSSNSSSPSGMVFQEILDNYKEKNTLIGIDVSKWQKSIDWEQVKNSGVEFAMIRLGTQKGIAEDSILDSFFKENIENAKKAGLKVGVYYFSYASSLKEAKTQATWVLKQLKPYELDLPIAFDWETFSLFNQLNISIYDLNEIANTFISEVQKQGYQGILYGSKNYLENMWIYQKQDIWLAHYKESTDYEGDYMMWQLSSTGLVPGIDGFVDINILYQSS